MLIDKLSISLAKALPTNSQANLYAPVNARNGEPTGDGYHDTGKDGGTSHNAICVQPYCEGPAGSQFSFRLWGWRNFKDDWCHFLIAEIACVACARNPLGSAPRPKYMTLLENFCDTLILIRGAAGILSYGPGSNLPGYAEIRIAGTKKISFDFQNFNPVSMNAFWAPCS